MSKVIKKIKEDYVEAKKKVGLAVITLKTEFETLKETDLLDYPEYDKDDEWSTVGEANWNIAIAQQLMKLAIQHLSLAGEVILIDEPMTSHLLPLAISQSSIASVYISTEGESPKLFTIVVQKD